MPLLPNGIRTEAQKTEIILTKPKVNVGAEIIQKSLLGIKPPKHPSPFTRKRKLKDCKPPTLILPEPAKPVKVKLKRPLIRKIPKRK